MRETSPEPASVSRTWGWYKYRTSNEYCNRCLRVESVRCEGAVAISTTRRLVVVEDSSLIKNKAACTVLDY